MLKRLVKWTFVVLVVLMVAAQFVRPARTNPPIDDAKTVYAYSQAPPNVKAILERSCWDCHSHATKWPWYSNVAPVSWYVIHDVNEARRNMNLSDWLRGGRFATKQDASQQFEDICEMVESGEMPLSQYLIFHRDAKLTDADRLALCNWAKIERAAAK